MAAGKQRNPHSEGCRWLLISGGEVRGWGCIWLDWREERAWLGRAIWGEALLGSCWLAVGGEVRGRGCMWLEWLLPARQGEVAGGACGWNGCCRPSR